MIRDPENHLHLPVVDYSMSGSQLIHAQDHIKTRIVDDNQVSSKFHVANNYGALLALLRADDDSASGGDVPVGRHVVASQTMPMDEPR